MKQALGVLGLVSLCAAAPSARGQEGHLAQIFYNKVKPGAQAQYEAARERHVAWHRAKSDTWAWLTWEIVTGDRTGTFVVGTFGRSFQDFDGRDDFEAQDAADSATSMGPFVESATQSLYVRRPDMGGPGPAPTPAKLAQVIRFQLNPLSVNDFVDSVKKIAEAAKKTSYPIQPDWYQLWSGGMGPEFVLVYGRNSWAELQPPDKTLDAMVEEGLGRTQAASVLTTLRRAVRYTDSELLVYRPELSYVPGK